MACFLIAEAGVNHNGSLERAVALVDAAAEAGADAVKFQTFRADRLARRGAPKARYQEVQTGAGDQYEMLQALELSEAAHHSILDRCRQRGIEFMSTAFDEESAAFLISLGIRRIKIPSGELTNRPFIEFLADLRLPMILSTGMADLEEVRASVAWIADRRRVLGLPGDLSEVLTVLHCTSNYPARPEDVNLLAMQTMAAALGLPVGYSDHTMGWAVAAAAVAAGASVLEKHLTLDRHLPGPDHQASLDPAEFAALVSAVRQVEVALGDGVKRPTASELPVRDVVRRSVTLNRDVGEGELLTAEHLSMLRPGTGIPPGDVVRVVGRRTRYPLPAGTTLQFGDLL